jgi:hypothetical protein
VFSKASRADEIVKGGSRNPHNFGNQYVDNNYDFASFLSFALAKSDIELALEVLSAGLVDQLTGR